MNLRHATSTSTVRDRPGTVTLAALLLLAAPMLQANPAMGATPRVVRSVAPEAKPNPTLEAALREALFPGQISDAQGHGPDLGSAEAKLAMQRTIKDNCERIPAHQYAWSQVDLNGDGRNELVAHVVGPILCGSGGCPLLIFSEPSPGTLTLITAMSLFKDPLIVTKWRHNGWRTLITRVRLDANRSDYAELPYDGRTYPVNPSVAPARPLRHSGSGTAYLEWKSQDPRTHTLACEAAHEEPLRINEASLPEGTGGLGRPREGCAAQNAVKGTNKKIY
jgi:hypothetical protein